MENYGIYVHIPFCKARCGYCAFCSCVDLSLREAYFQTLFDEIRQAKNHGKIGSVYVGGGTPSAVGEQYLNRLFAELRAKFTFADDCEITVECNPESVTQSLAESLAQNGVNRVSLGLQSVNNATLKKIGRLHTFDEFCVALDALCFAGITNVNADLILGLPESQNDFLRSVQTVAALPLSHVSVYALELYPDAPLNRFKDEICADQDVLADMYDSAVATFAEYGFFRYETSNFAKDGKRCRHNLNYWQEGRYYGFGAAASGFEQNTRYSHVADVQGYIDCPSKTCREQISLDEQAKEFVMLGLRLDDGIDLLEFSRRYNADFFDFFDQARRLLQQGFLAVVGNSVVIPSDKTYVANSVLAELL